MVNPMCNGSLPAPTCSDDDVLSTIEGILTDRDVVVFSKVLDRRAGPPIREDAVSNVLVESKVIGNGFGTTGYCTKNIKNAHSNNTRKCNTKNAIQS